MATSASQTAPVNALQASLGPDAYKAFEHYIMTEISPEMETIRKTPSTVSENDYRELIARCARHITKKVYPVLVPMLDKGRALIVRAELHLNTIGTDLGIEYKETEMFKSYIGMVSDDNPDKETLLAKLMERKNPTTTTPISGPVPTSGSIPDDSQLAPATFLDAPLDHLAPDDPSESSVNPSSVAKSRREGPNRIDIHMSIQFEEGFEHINGPKQILLLLIENKYIPEKLLKGTVLAAPAQATEPTSSVNDGMEAQLPQHAEVSSVGLGVVAGHMEAAAVAGPGEVAVAEKAESPAATIVPNGKVIKKLQSGIAQTVWYSAAIDAMSSSSSSGTSAGRPGRPIYSMLFVNGWFVRMVLQDKVLRIETVDSSVQTTSGTMIDFLKWFQDGTHLPHHITTHSGAEKFHTWCGAAIQTMVPALEPIAAPKSTTLPFQGIHELSVNDPDDVSTASLFTDTGIKATPGLKRGQATAVTSDDEPGNSAGRRKKTRRVRAVNAPAPRASGASTTSSSSGAGGGGPGSGTPRGSGVRGRRGSGVRAGAGKGKSKVRGSTVEDEGKASSQEHRSKTQRLTTAARTRGSRSQTRTKALRARALEAFVYAWQCNGAGALEAPIQEDESIEGEEYIPDCEDDAKYMDWEDYMKYMDIRDQMEVLHKIGWKVEYCSVESLDRTVRGLC